MAYDLKPLHFDKLSAPPCPPPPEEHRDHGPVRTGMLSASLRGHGPPSKCTIGTNYVLWTGEGEVTRARGARNRAPLALVNP